MIHVVDRFSSKKTAFVVVVVAFFWRKMIFFLFMRTVGHLNVLTSPVSKLCPRLIVLILLA